MNPPVGGWSGRNDRLTGGCGEVWDVWANPLAADNKQGRLFYRVGSGFGSLDYIQRNHVLRDKQAGTLVLPGGKQLVVRNPCGMSGYNC